MLIQQMTLISVSVLFLFCQRAPARATLVCEPIDGLDAPGTIVMQSILVEEASSCFTFSANNGQAIAIQLTRSPGVVLALYQKTGSSLSEARLPASDQQVAFTAIAGSSYRLELIKVDFKDGAKYDFEFLLTSR